MRFCSDSRKAKISFSVFQDTYVSNPILEGVYDGKHNRCIRGDPGRNPR